MCEMAIRQYERMHGIPDKLLMAISIVESGRKMPGGKRVAWPWTINANGEPFVFQTKKEAVDKVRALQAAGVQSIDVGCMQVNLKHHPDAFRTLEEAFDPYVNIAYAARFLKQKQQDHGSWHNAVAHYHSATPEHHIPYRERVLKTWSHVQQTPAYNQPGVINTIFPHEIKSEPHVEFNKIETKMLPQTPGAIPGRMFPINAARGGRGGGNPSPSLVGGVRPGQIQAVKAAYRMKQFPIIKTASMEQQPPQEGAFLVRERAGRGFPIH